jgi:type VI secretion system protein ImpC
MQTADSGLEAIFSLENNKTGIVEEPPFRLLVLGDWSGDAEKRPLELRFPIEIDRDNLDEMLARLGTRLDLDLGDGGTLALEFGDFDDFHPDSLYRRVPLFNDLRTLRKRLNDESTFHSAAREVRAMLPAEEPVERVEIPANDSAEPADNLLDAILAKPDGGGDKPKPKVSSDLSNLIGDLMRPHLVSVDDDERSGYVAAIDESISGLMRSILHNRHFQELEAAWRGLYFLVRRTETSTDLKIYLFDVSKDELADDLKSAESLADSQLYRHLLKESIETPGGEPWALAVGNYAFSPNVDDVATLMRVSKIAAAANCSFVSHMRPDVLGVHSLVDNSDPAKWDLSENSEAGKLWNALRLQDESKYLGMTIPRFLARLPYGRETDPLETFSFEELTEQVEHDAFLWANTAFIVAQLIAESYSEYGWQMGRSLIQDAEGLPMHIYKDGTETIFRPCGEVLLTENAVELLLDHGLMPLVSYKNTDKVRLARFQSIAETGLNGMWI